MSTITDWIMVVITLVYVVATIAICKANIKSAKATREQLNESKRQFEHENRAFVTVDFEIIRNGLIALRIKNHGKQIARDVRVKVNKDFLDNIKEESDRQHLCVLCNSCFTLGIGQSWYVCFGSHLQLPEMSDVVLCVDITYCDESECYEESILIDLKQYYWAILYNSPFDDINQELRKIGKNIEQISKNK